MGNLSQIDLLYITFITESCLESRDKHSRSDYLYAEIYVTMDTCWTVVGLPATGDLQIEETTYTFHFPRVQQIELSENGLSEIFLITQFFIPTDFGIYPCSARLFFTRCFVLSAGLSADDYCVCDQLWDNV